MTARQAARTLRGLKPKVYRLVDKGVGKSARAAVTFAKWESSGPFSGRALAAMDHPYARRHGRPLLDPSIVNVQSGLFRQSWQVERKAFAKGGDQFTVANRTSYADYLDQGTRFMFARPIATVVKAYWTTWAVVEIEKALTDAGYR